MFCNRFPAKRAVGSLRSRMVKAARRRRACRANRLSSCNRAVERPIAQLAHILTHADTAVASDAEAGFTTLIGLCVSNNRVSGASCGDSAIVAICGAEAPRVLTSRQFKNPPVGCGDATFVPFKMELTPPWKVLAMTDGVWKYAGWERVWDCAARLSGAELIAELQVAARLQTTGEFQDDFTVVLLESE